MYKDLVGQGFLKKNDLLIDEVTWPWPLHLQGQGSTPINDEKVACVLCDMQFGIRNAQCVLGFLSFGLSPGRMAAAKARAACASGAVKCFRGETLAYWSCMIAFEMLLF